MKKITKEEHIKRRKLFKRLLKEMGLYSAWVDARKIEKTCEKSLYNPIETDEDKAFSFIDSTTSLSWCINNSFTWSSTNPYLWRTLYNALFRNGIDTKFDDLEKNGICFFLKNSDIIEKMKPYLYKNK